MIRKQKKQKTMVSHLLVNIHEYQDYRRYLRDWIDSLKKDGRGAKSKIARALRCSPSYLTAVLKEEANLSLEQAEGLNAFFGHSNHQAEYFNLLVLRARAGTFQLKQQLDSMIENHLRQAFTPPDSGIRIDGLHSTFGSNDEILPGRVLVLMGSNKYRKPKDIARFFGLSVEKIESLLSAMEGDGTIHRLKGGEYSIAGKHISTTKSPLAKRLSKTLSRLEAVRHINLKQDDGHHGTMSGTLSHEDYLKALGILKKAHEEISKIVSASSDGLDDFYILNFDLFRLEDGRSIF